MGKYIGHTDTRKTTNNIQHTMKHLFTFTLAAALLCSAAGFPAQGGERKKKDEPQPQKIALGVWDDVDKDATVEEIIEWMAPFDQAGIKNYYMCGTPEETARYIEAAKAYPGAKIHAWMFSMNAPGDSVAYQHPEWFDVNRLGNNSLEYDPYVKHYKWLSPSSPGARQHVKEKAAALAALDGLASVHLDFIRYNDAILGRQLQRDKFHIEQDTYRAEYDFGYHPEAIEKFKAIFGYSPLELKQPWLSPEWLQFRLNEVSSLVNEIVAETHAAGKQVSAAVFPYPTRARMTVYQDWPAWDIDIVCPMNYNSFYLEGIDWIGFSVENGVRETQGKNLYVSGLFVPDLSAEELYQAAKLSIEKGAKGVNFFNARSLLRGDKLKAVERINQEFNLQ